LRRLAQGNGSVQGAKCTLPYIFWKKSDADLVWHVDPPDWAPKSGWIYLAPAHSFSG
jgi:hypothetical protein